MRVESEAIKAMIEQGIPGSRATVSGDGRHFEATVISAEFAGKTPVKKQQLVFAALGDNITSGAIHALNIKTFTPEEWEGSE